MYTDNDIEKKPIWNDLHAKYDASAHNYKVEDPDEIDKATNV